ncbi:MAG: protein-L-isoaspartate O-methyltransferase [Gammaproteobacteria bacterium]|nr:protein-L-isoaspartate O-methyltransferase [Gammaproteobacteria bacterium]
MDYESARKNMLTNQLRCWNVSDSAVLQVMGRMSRESFLPASLAAFAYCDEALPLSETASMLPPKIQGRVLQALAIRPGERVLEVGSGSGYLTAVMAGLGATVCGVEIDPTLAEFANRNLNAVGLSDITVETGDASRGWGRHGPYDAIAVMAAMPEYDDCFAQDLAVGGRLVVFVGAPPVVKARLVQRIEPDKWVSSDLFETEVEPLVNAATPVEFEF